jgi:hypothetical protein
MRCDLAMRVVTLLFAFGGSVAVGIAVGNLAYMAWRFFHAS